MSENYLYLLDANVFINAYRQYYAFDIAPSFWDEITKNEKVISIEPIKEELQSFGKEDGLSQWALSTFHNWFQPIDNTEIITVYGDLMNWAHSHKQYNPPAKEEFAQVADAWLIAYAKVYDCKLVTHEAFKPDIKKKIPIPNVCKEHNVSYIDTFQMIRELGIKFS